MEASRYLDCLAADYGDLRDAVATVEPTVTVPSCPGWTVADLVVHVSQVYLHRGRPHAHGGGAPAMAPAPPGRRAPAGPAWFGPDQTVAF